MKTLPSSCNNIHSKLSGTLSSFRRYFPATPLEENKIVESETEGGMKRAEAWYRKIDIPPRQHIDSPSKRNILLLIDFGQLDDTTTLLSFSKNFRYQNRNGCPHSTET